MTTWLAPLAQRVRRAEACVLVTVAAVRGSAPREPGAKMIVTARETFDTIGGGNLELAAIEGARELLAPGPEPGPRARLVRYPLGPGMQQCCGGAVRILFERVDASDAWWVDALVARERAGENAVLASVADGPRAGRKVVVVAGAREGTLGDAALDAAAVAESRALLALPDTDTDPRLHRLAAAGATALVLLEPVRPPDFAVLVFGAGHVGRALVDVLATTHCRITWVDSRPGQFPDSVPAHVRTVTTGDPAAEIAGAAAGACCVVLTHSHALDYELVEHALARDDLAYVGMIGSTPKRNRLVKYLRDEGVSEDRIDRLICPIGVPGIGGKHPATIAIAVAAQLLQRRETPTGAAPRPGGPAERERRRRALERLAGSA